jgi:hypothetical protein
MAKHITDEYLDQLLEKIRDQANGEIVERNWSFQHPAVISLGSTRDSKDVQLDHSRAPHESTCRVPVNRWSRTFHLVLGTRRRQLIAAAACLLVASAITLVFQSRVQGAGLHSIAGKTREELRDQFPAFAALQRAPNALPSGTTAIDGPDDIPTPKYDESFEIRRESKLYDMTWWQPIDPAKRESGRLSPVVFTRVLELRRIPGRTGNRKISLKYWTSGYSVEPVRLKADDEVIRAKKLENLSATGPAMKTFLLTTDVSDHAEGVWFQLAISAVYWNGFNTPEKEIAASAVASGTVEDTDLGVILPPLSSAIKGWALYDIPPHEKRAPYNQFKAGRPLRDESGMLYWPIAHVEADHKYVMEWEWADPATSTRPNGSLTTKSTTDASSLRDNAIPLHSQIGQQFLRESEANEFVDLSLHFVTQDNTAFCGVASSVMVLNASGMERPLSPAHGTFRLWTQQNFWSEATRKVADETVVKREGMTLDTLGAMLSAHGMHVDVRHAGDLSVEDFQHLIEQALKGQSSYVLVNYYRPVVGQDGAGHISPVAAYHAASDRCLVLDVARYRYEPMWISTRVLYRAAAVKDSSSGQTRGLIICRNPKGDARERASTAPTADR